MEKIRLFSGSANVDLARKTAEFYKSINGEHDYPGELSKCFVKKFSDNEIKPVMPDSVRDARCFVIQPLITPAEIILETGFMGRTLSANAKEVVAIIPYFGYARQDRRDESGVAIGAKFIADLLSISGFKRIVTIDLHADQIEGFFNIPVDHLDSGYIFVPYIRSFNLDNVVLVAPDNGASKRVKAYADVLGLDMVVCYKSRKIENKVSEIKVLGEVDGKDCILIDDILDTGGTLCKTADVLKEKGAVSVRAIVTHFLGTGDACKNIMNSVLTEVATTDSIPLGNKKCDKLKVISLNEMLGLCIQRMVNHQSLETLFSFKKSKFKK